MAGHWHDPSAATQNQGNQLGSRPCVRQSQLFRQNESGNTMKSLLGSSHLQWDTKHTQGAYAGRPAYDAHTDYAAQTSIQGKYHCANEMTNPFPIPHKKEWADLGPYRAQVNAATRAQEAAMAKKGRKGGKPKLFARSTDLSRDRRAQKRAAGKRSSRIGLREPELRSVLSGAGDEELLEATLSKYSVAEDAEEGNAVMAQWRDDRSLMSRGSVASRGSMRTEATAASRAVASTRPW
jgi:hypothetical protein